MSWLKPEFGCIYARERGKDVRIVALGPFNAVGQTDEGKFMLFGLDGVGVGCTGNLTVKKSHFNTTDQ